jgi:hypothetical protein
MFVQVLPAPVPSAQALPPAQSRPVLISILRPFAAAAGVVAVPVPAQILHTT